MSEIHDLIRDLHSSEHLRRARAMTALVGLGPAVVPVLRAELSRGYPETAPGLIDVLARIDEPAAWGALLFALTSPNLEIRRRAFEALCASQAPDLPRYLRETVFARGCPTHEVLIEVARRRRDPEAVPWLAGVVQTGVPPHVSAALEALRTIGGPPVVRALIEVLQFSAERASPPRGLIIRALGELGDPAAVGLLCRGREREGVEVLEARVTAIVQIGPVAIPELVSEIQRSDIGAPAAMEALKRFGPRAVPHLCRALEDASESGSVRILTLLGELGDLAAVPALVRALFGDTGRGLAFARRQVVLTLWQIGGDEALSVLRDALLDWDSSVRGTAAVALVRHGVQDPGLIPHLITALADPQEQVRDWAIDGLAALAAVTPARALRKALPALRRLASPWSLIAPETRRAARAAIEAIEAATSRHSLPLPAKSPAPGASGLPLPGDSDVRE